MENVYKVARDIRISFMNNESLDTPVYNEFKTRYPKLFTMMQNPNMDTDMFENLFKIIYTKTKNLY